VEQVLPALQQAGGAQGIEVTVATEALVESKKNVLGRLVDFFREVRGEIQKVTWPSVEELRKATLVIIVFVALLGVFIGIMDTLLQFIFVTGVASLFR
jgi:preprotein translocase subunit SecE